MKNNEKINDLIKKVNATTNEFLMLPNPCAYSDRLVENIIHYAEKNQIII